MKKLFYMSFNTGFNPEYYFPGWVKPTILLLAIILSCLLFIPFSPWMPADGLDPSWVYAVNQAVERDLIFGSDFIFTYGPLGYISTTQYSPGTDTRMLLGSAVFIIGFMFSIYFSTPKNRQWWLLLLPIVFMVTRSREPFIMAFPFFLLLAIARIILPSSSSAFLPLTKMRMMALAVSTYVIGMIPLVKASLIGVAFPVSGIAFLLLWFYKKKLAISFAALILFSVCANWIISGQSLDDMFRWAASIIPIVSGYTNAMSLRGKFFSILYFLFAAGIVSFAFFRAILPISKRLAWIIIAGMMLTLFVAFKAGFVRQDGHVLLTLGVLLLLTYGASLYVRPGLALCLWVVVSLSWSFLRESSIDLTPRYIKNELVQ